MRRLLEAGAVLLAPALAGAVALEEDSIPSAFITLHLPQSEDASAAQDLIFRFDIQESTEACGSGSVTINGQSLPEGGSGLFTVDDDRLIDATWNLTCVAWNGVPQEQLLSLNVEAVNGQFTDDVGFTLRFQQVAPVWISDVEGSASMTRVHSTNQAKPPCDEDEVVDVDAALAELDYLRWRVAELHEEIHMKEVRLSKALGWPSRNGPPPMITDCDSIKCAVRVLYHQIKDTASSIYGGDYFPGRPGPRPHGMMPGGPHHGRPHGMPHAQSHPPFAHAPEHRGDKMRNGTQPHPPHSPHFAHPPPFCKCGPPGPPHGPPQGPQGPPPPPGAFPPPPPAALPPPPPPGSRPGPPGFEHGEPFPPSHHIHHGPGPQGPGAHHHWSPAPEEPKEPKEPKEPTDERTSKMNKDKTEEFEADVAADLPEAPTEAELRRDPYYEENHPPKHASDFEERPHAPAHHEPPVHDGPEDFPPPPPPSFDDDDGPMPAMPPPSFEDDGPMPPPPPPPFDHDGSMPPPPPPPPPFDHDGSMPPPPPPPPPFGPDGQPMPPPPPPPPGQGPHHGPRGMIFVHIASVSATIILLGIFIKVLTQRCAARRGSGAFSHRRRRSYNNAPWYKKLYFGPHYYSRLDDEEKEAMLRDCDSDCTSVEGDEDVVARDISTFRTSADVVGEMVAVEEGRMLMAQHAAASPYAHHHHHSSPAHSRQTSAAQLVVTPQQASYAPQVQVNAVLPIAVSDHAAAMFPDLHHDDEALPAYQEADRGDDDDASELASSLMADGYRPGCSGTYTPSESGSQGAGDILGDTKN